MHTLSKEQVKFTLDQIGYDKEFVVIFYKASKKRRPNGLETSTGEQRKMRCKMEVPSGPLKNPNVVPVVDLDLDSWRSFRVDTVLSISY